MKTIDKKALNGFQSINYHDLIKKNLLIDGNILFNWTKPIETKNKYISNVFFNVKKKENNKSIIQ